MSVKESKLELTPEFVLELTHAQPQLFGFVLKRIGNVELAQEVLQEVNLVICRKAMSFEPGTDFMAWAFAIARFRILAFRQERARDRLVFPDELYKALEDDDAVSSGAEVFGGKLAALKRCLDRLDRRSRDLVVERYQEAISVKNIAESRGKTANAISLMLHRIREDLGRCIRTQVASEDQR